MGDTMNTITGKVNAVPSNLGIPNLIVVVYDVDPDGKPEEIIRDLPAFAGPQRRGARAAVATPRNELGILGDRIGSVLTGPDGSFSLSYEDSEYQIRNPTEKRPDLFLMVFVPEQSGKSIRDLLLFFSPEIRQNAGRNEAYFIAIEEARLKEKGVPLPEPRETNTGLRIAAYQRRIEATARFDDAVVAVQRQKIAARQEGLKALKTDFQKILVAATPPAENFTTFVADGERVADKLPGHVAKETGRVNNTLARHAERRKGVEVTFVLSADDKAELGINTTSDDSITLDADQLKGILSRLNAAGANNLVITSDNPIVKYCLKESDETTSASQKLDAIVPPPSPDPAVPIADDEPMTSEDIAPFVHRVLTELRLKLTTTGAPRVRSDATTVDASVDKFSLKKGPAELPSLFDFQVLQVAFGHLWQQLVDEAPAELAAEATSLAQERGYRLDFSRALASRGLLTTFHGLSKAYSTPPQAVVASFDISYEEWNALDPALQNKLEDICDAIEKANAGLIFDPDGSVTSTILGRVTTPPGFHRVSPYMAEQFLQKLREQGELIIDYIRCNNGRSLHKILADLDAALKSNYLFTIFGADPSARAVNFGLLNTYRQKWEPTAYQVGDLVKSIPLAPKEEKKYALKTTFNRKRSEKEARKNNSSIHQEQNTTSRAEQEIVSKAQTKTDFKLSAEANYSKWKVASSLGFDSAKESQQSKKDFREAVLKATQEFKEERSVEIDTEETYSSESTESGTISNPNDELAVTYLFYELQKRFKVSEQLYRIMPTVLIAQDVPAPHEITEAWIIAHDWILNRALLDDSFRPALQYIAQKNVGDDYGIRELRKNLRTQRQLVASLKLELSTLRKESDNRYVALEAAIDKRIGEESDRNTDNFWNNVGEFFGGDKEDPEGAKSREMAAKDAHEYAVEKAEKAVAALQREVNTLHQLTAEYNNAMRDHLDRKTMVARLKTHIKNNIIYYMQTIWSLEPPDQRFMRLLNTEVPFLEFEEITCELEQKPADDLFAEFRDGENQETLHRAFLRATLRTGEPRPLVEVADLDTPLGYLGNYIVFPLKQHNALTELMAMPYVDAAFGAMDPDQLSNVSLEDYARYVCCLEAKLPKEKFEALVPTLKAWLKLLLSDPLRNGDEIILPTNSLYIEVLTSANTLLEDFKLEHREWDVYKVQEEVRMQALENLRYAKRILLNELEDPNIEKRISVQGLPAVNGIHVGDD
jgi:hypothetical protein